MKYTLVRHSGWCVGRKPEFRQAVEEHPIHRSQEAKVLRVGGVLYDDYAAASTACQSANYPLGVDGLVPRVPGSFATRVNIGSYSLEVYVPPARELESVGT